MLSVPANGWVSSPYGPRNIPSSPFHHGIDYGYYYATYDLRVFAAAPGIIQHAYFSESMGWVISILHEDGSVTEYCHLRDGGLFRVGTTVARRQHVGTMGSTGTTSLGELHLHFVYWVNGSRVNPAKYMSGGSGGDPIPIVLAKEEEMHVIERTGGTPEWSLIWPALVGASDIERGYIVTSDPNRAKWWQRFYAQGSGTADKFGRDEYVEAQKFAREDYVAWRRGQPGGSVVVDLTATNAAIATVDQKVSRIPTTHASYAVSMTAIPK